VLDLTTMVHAIQHLSEVMGLRGFQRSTREQSDFLSYFLRYKERIAKLAGLEALASPSADVLNDFLEARGFDRMFGDVTGLGVASVLDMLLEWLGEVSPTTIYRHDPQAPLGLSKYSAFKIIGNGVDIFSVDGYEHPLACLYSWTGDKLWLMRSDEPESGIKMALDAQKMLNAPRRLDLEWTAGAIVPDLEINTKPDISWLKGFSFTGPIGSPHAVTDSFQQYKLRVNREGARVKVATGVSVRSAGGPKPYVFDEPFIGFFTQSVDHELVIAPFFADIDCWQSTGATLADF